MGQATWLEFALGVVLMGNGVMTCVLMYKYDEFEKLYEEEGRRDTIGDDVMGQIHSWVNLDTSINSLVAP